MKSAGFHSSHFLLFNRNNVTVKPEINATELTFDPGQAQLLHSSSFRNKLHYELDGKAYQLDFGTRQHIVK